MSTEITQIIRGGVAMAVKSLYELDVTLDSVSITNTKKDFEGDYSVVVFPYTKVARKKPEVIAEEIGTFLLENLRVIKSYNVIKGFLNLVVEDEHWISFVNDLYQDDTYGLGKKRDEKVMVEFSSPNTNKPLHLGHIRNNLLGWSVCQILEADGYEVVKANLVNDRGIHICKSMLAWQKYGNGETPESTGLKGDHLVGKYYVEFDKRFKAEFDEYDKSVDEVVDKNKYFNEQSSLGKEVKEMLLKWEQGDEEVFKLWRTMNDWVLDGHADTYDKLGVEFDKYYFESDTYKLGKDIVDYGVDKKIFYKQIDGSVWIDLEDAGLDKKLLLRSDGTSVYMTQDIGTARLKYDDYKIDKSVYVVADEQNYHFQVLFEVLKRLEEPYAEGLSHLSYGMVNLPNGRMKSREGTVVDADELIKEVVEQAIALSKDRGMLDELSEVEQREIYRKIGLGALKFFILRVNPKKSMTFNPEESLDFQGQTGPFIQNAFIRIKSILRKYTPAETAETYKEIQQLERELILLLNEYPSIIKEAAKDYDPAVVANYCYAVAKAFHRFYHDVPMLRAESEAAKAFRVRLSVFVSNVLNHGFSLLGVEMPERM